ncbi:MAG TPA: class I SAM-dependent methyltransferase [Chloroflexia bacterium]|nr:class I SAM-dependent methyltransferase [Chloroflexia bacterium]
MATVQSRLKASEKWEDQPFRFDYEDTSTVEGRGELRKGTRDLAALRLERCLEAISSHTGSLLEIGCGAGRYTRAFLHYRPELEVHGCDISQVALEEARQADRTGKIDYVLGDALDLPYPNNSFDIVVLFDVFEHVTDVGKAASEVARVLKPGGVFHCFVPCEGNKRTIFALLRHSKRVPIHMWKRVHIGHIQVLTTKQMKQILLRRELRVTDATFSFHILGQIHDVFDYWRRDMLSHDDLAKWQRVLVRAISRAVFIPTWRLAYFEDTLRKRNPSAIGVHLTARSEKAA